MATIILETKVNAPILLVFDLARSIDLHVLTSQKTHEKAIAGRTSGLINCYETVTWSAKHFGITQQLTSAITAMKAPFYFEDQMLKGAFKRIHHKHYFSTKNGQTVMKDIFEFKSPLGLVGKLIDNLFMRRYLENFIRDRNLQIKDFAENEEKWMQVLNVY